MYVRFHTSDQQLLCHNYNVLVRRQQRYHHQLRTAKEASLAQEAQQSQPHPCGPYPPIEKLGAVGDRRTAAVVATDGTISWMCLPDYGSPPVFGALLDVEHGGCWRIGPADLSEAGLGRQA